MSAEFKESTFPNDDEKNLQSSALSEIFRNKRLKFISIYDENRGYGEELRIVFEDDSKLIIENFNHEEPIMLRIEYKK